MKCKCVQTVEANVLDRVSSDNEGKGTIGKVQMLNMGISFDEISEGWHTSQPVEYEFTPIKKDGSKGKTINKKIDVYHTYCPFCGDKIIKN